MPHIFFGGLTAWVDRQADVDDPMLRALLGDLEHAMRTAADDVQELIAVSFLENLPTNSRVWRVPGPDLKAEAARLFGDTDPRARR